MLNFIPLDPECISQNSVVLPSLYAPANTLHPTSESQKHREAEGSIGQSCALFYQQSHVLFSRGLLSGVDCCSAQLLDEVPRNAHLVLTCESIQRRLPGNIVCMYHSGGDQNFQSDIKLWLLKAHLFFAIPNGPKPATLQIISANFTKYSFTLILQPRQ